MLEVLFWLLLNGKIYPISPSGSLQGSGEGKICVARGRPSPSILGTTACTLLFGGVLGTRRTTKFGDARRCMEWGGKKFRTMAVACVLRTYRCTCKCVGSFAVSASRYLCRPRSLGIKATLFAAMSNSVGELVGYSCRHMRHCPLNTIAKLAIDDNTPRLHRSWLFRATIHRQGGYDLPRTPQLFSVAYQ